MERSPIQGTAAWVEHLARSELPVVAGVVSELTRLTEQSDVSASKLVEVILRDATLTSQVLRVANNPYYQQAGARQQAPVTSVSRAVSQIGFSGIRAIIVSLMFIDSLFRNKPKATILSALARSFHAAVQAKDLMRSINEHLAEDAFISALLYQVGELAFWTWGGKSAEMLSRHIEEEGGDLEVLAKACLGTDLKSISQELAGRWHLGETLSQALDHNAVKGPAAQAVLLGNAIAASAEHGWNSPEFTAVLDQVTAFTGKRREQLRQRIIENAMCAAEVAEGYGAGQICAFIPSSFDVEGVERAPLAPNAQFQLDTLRELSDLLSKKTDINTIFQVVLEGMHRGVGLERVALLILNPERSLLQTKYVLGDALDKWREYMKLGVDSRYPSPLGNALETRQPMWLKPRGAGVEFYTPAYAKLFGHGAAFIAPIYAGSRSMGVFFADRGGCGELSETQYNNFCHFAQQANLALSVLAGR